MLKFAITLVTLYSLLIVGTTWPVSAQPQPASPQPAPSVEQQNSNQSKPDLKQTVAAETEKLKAGSATFDADKSQRDNATQQVKKKGWSTKNKLLLAAVIVGFVGLIFVVTKYYHKCLRSSPPGCTPGVDENCVCEEYERRIPQNQ